MTYQKKSSAKTPLEHLQNDRNRLSAMQRHCKYLNSLEHTLYRYLDEVLHPHCQVLNYRQGILILKAESSVWAARLRLQLPHLLRYLRREKDLTGLVSIDVVVRPENEVPTSQATTSPTLTPAAKASLKDCADTLPAGKLKDIIDKMAD